MKIAPAAAGAADCVGTKSGLSGLAFHPGKRVHVLADAVRAHVRDTDLIRARGPCNP